MRGPVTSGAFSFDDEWGNFRVWKARQRLLHTLTRRPVAEIEVAKTNITRLDGESEADFQRRYKREYMRAFYARKRATQGPKPPRKKRAYRSKYNIARREGETQDEFDQRYALERQRINRAKAKGASADVNCEVLMKTPRKGTSIEEWEALKQLPGETEDEWTKRCANLRHAKWRNRDPQHAYAIRRKWRDDNDAQYRAKAREWRLNNPEKIRETGLRYFHAHREERLRKLKLWAVANPERVREVRRLWYDANAGKRAQYGKDRRFRMALATPLWADMTAIQDIYEQCARQAAESSIPHDVDHEIPLIHPLVCGLHVQGNLRVMTARENRKKHNKFNPADFDWSIGD